MALPCERPPLIFHPSDVRPRPAALRGIAGGVAAFGAGRSDAARALGPGTEPDLSPAQAGSGEPSAVRDGWAVAARPAVPARTRPRFTSRATPSSIPPACRRFVDDCATLSRELRPWRATRIVASALPAQVSPAGKRSGA